MTIGIKTIYKFIVTLILCYPMILIAATPAWSLEQLMQSLSAIPSRHAYFTEEKTLAMLKKKLIIKGFLHYEAPDYMKREIISPQHEIYEIRSDELLINRGERRLALSDYPVFKAFVDSFRATLAGDLPKLRQHYRIWLKGKKSDWVLSLYPSNQKLARYVKIIKMSGSFNRIVKIETLESDGDHTLMILTPYLSP